MTKTPVPSEDLYLAVRPSIAVCLVQPSPALARVAARHYPVVPAETVKQSAMRVRLDSQSDAVEVPWNQLGAMPELHCTPDTLNWGQLEEIAELHAFCRGELPLHAAACEHNERGIVIVGGAHSGKTGVLLAMMEQGATFISDDGVIIDADGRAVGVSTKIDLRKRYWQQSASILEMVPASARLRSEVLEMLKRIGCATPPKWRDRIASAVDRRQRLTFSAPDIYGELRCRQQCDVTMMVVVSEGYTKQPVLSTVSVAEMVEAVVPIQLQQLHRLLLAYKRDVQHTPALRNATLDDFATGVRQRVEAIAENCQLYRLVVPAEASREAILDVLNALLQSHNSADTLAYAP